METRQRRNVPVFYEALGNFLSGMETAAGRRKTRDRETLETSLVEWKPMMALDYASYIDPWKLP